MLNLKLKIRGHLINTLTKLYVWLIKHAEMKSTAGIKKMCVIYVWRRRKNTLGSAWKVKYF